MNEHADAAVVRSAYEALSRGDMAAFADSCTRTSSGTSPQRAWKATTTGRDQTLAFLARVFQESGLEMPSMDIQDIAGQ